MTVETRALTRSSSQEGWLERLHRWVEAAVLLLATLFALAAVYAVLVNGRDSQRTAERLVAQEIAEENRAFCAKHSSAGDLASCAADLAQIRVNQDRRRNDADFFLP